MDTVYSIIVVVHLLGMAALVGAWFVQMTARTPAALTVMVWGARTQLISGLVLVGLGEAVLDQDYDQIKIGVKFLIGGLVVALTEYAAARSGRGELVPARMVQAAGGLAVLNVLVAALWH